MSNDIEKIFEAITGVRFDVMLDGVVNHYNWSLMSDKKRRAKKNYLRRYYRRSLDKDIRNSAVRNSKDAVSSSYSWFINYPVVVR